MERRVHLHFEGTTGNMPTMPITADSDAKTNASRPIRVLAFMEAYSVTGPAKNLIEFARQSAVADEKSTRVQVTIATYQRGNIAEPNSFIRAARAAGVEVRVISEKRAFDLSVLGKMRTLLSEIRPDIVQTHNVKSHFLACLSGVPRQYPWIAFHHGYTRTDLKDFLYSQLDRWSLRRARRVVAVCQAFAADLEKGGIAADRILVRHNMVKKFIPATAEKVETLRSKFAIPQEALVGICVGRLSQEKGQIDLIRALGQLRQHPMPVNFRIIIVGDGPERAKLQDEALQLRVSANVIFAGFDPDTAPYYSLADFAVLPSHSEGSPNALLEAMAAGLPTVCTRVGGVPEIAINESTALITYAVDPNALSGAIHKLLIDPALRRALGENAQSAAVHFSPDAYCSSILQAYRELS
jgi:glycosyltransferase involved in cell wall biosynthesis